MALTGEEPASAPDVELSVLVVGYNAGDWLQVCLDSLRGAGRPSCTCEVVVVDNASTPGLAAVLDVDAQVRLVTLEQNVGFGNAVNFARGLARGRRLLLLNPDVEVLSGSLDALLTFHTDHPEAGIVGGRTDSPDGRIDPRNAFDQPSLWSQVCFAVGASTAFPRSALVNPEAIPDWDRRSVRQVGVVTGCCLLVDAALFDRLGGFDPRFFLYGEDVDLSRRAAEAGFRPTITPSAIVVHEFGASSTPARKRIMVLRGKATLYRRPGHRVTNALSGTLLAAGVLLRSRLEKLGRSGDESWTIAWDARAEWRDGWTDSPVPVVVADDTGVPGRE